MKIVVYNEKQLDVVVKDMYSKFSEYKSLQIDYNKPYKEKTLKQLGFFFGALVDSVIDYYSEKGETWTIEDVKENFYQATSYIEESLLKRCKRFNGEEYFVPKRLSEMSIDEASLFIDRCIFLIDKAKCFNGLVLHPSIRYTWVRNITKDDIDNLRFLKLPRQDKNYLEYQRKQACIWCGKQNCSEVHHLKEANYTGVAYKADDWLTVPLCHDCHISGFHTKGKQAFEDSLTWITKYISLVDFCKINYNKWKNHI